MRVFIGSVPPSGHHNSGCVPPWLTQPIVALPMPPGYSEPDEPVLPIIDQPGPILIPA